MILFEKSIGIKTFLQQGKLEKKTRAYVLRMLVAFVMHFGKMSASRAGEAVRTQARHRANVARFLADCRWSRDWNQCFAMAVLLLEEERKRPGKWLFLLDQTCCSQQGSKTENTTSTGNRKRRPCKSRRYNKPKYAKKSIHIFVMGVLLTPSGLRLPVSRSYYTKKYCEAKKWKYRKQSELAADLIRELQVPEAARVIVVGDTAYDAAVIRDACRERHYTWIVPLNPERVLAGKKPRPKVRSLVSEMSADQFAAIRLNPHQGAFVAQRRISRCRIRPKVKRRTFYVQAEIQEVHSVGKVQLVFSCKEQPKKGKPIPLSKILMTNDVTMKAGLVVEIYSLRWQIELFFKELKSTLGFHRYRFRQYEKVETWVQIALVSFLYLEWYRGRQLRSRRLTAEGKAWWRSQRTYGLCRAVRQRAEANELGELARLMRTKTGQKKLKKTLHAALPLEYRVAA
jgi:Transposase DDE domain